LNNHFCLSCKLVLGS